MVKQEGVGISQAGSDAPLGLLSGLRGVLHGEGAEELHHDQAGLLAPSSCQEDLVQQSVKFLELFSGEWRLTLLEHCSGGDHVSIHGRQLTSLSSQTHKVVVNMISDDTIHSQRLK